MLRPLFFITAVVLDTLIFALLAIIAGLFGPYSSLNTWFMQTWARIILWAAGVRLQVNGKENIEPRTSYIVIANHQSHMDIPITVWTLGLPLRIISKKELFKIPVFGWAMKAIGMLKIDRTNRKQAMETLNKAETVIRTHRLSILAFPEGTRSADGQIHPFKKGPFILAINTGLPILPVSISGTRNVLPKGEIGVTPGWVRVVIHSPVQTDILTLQDRHQLVREINQTISEGFIENYG